VYSRDPEFYAFSRTLEVYGEGANKNAVLILTTDSDYYRYLKHAAPEGDERLPAGGAHRAKQP
jgi:membrane protease subunit HflC